jgi:type IX secretion system PorP/SprF family membrane protein
MQQWLRWLVGILFVGGHLVAQDPHFSQPEFAPQYQNPAQTGVFAGEHRFAALWRQQWQSVPVPYRTLAASYDAPIAPERLRNGRLGVGVQLLWDEAGDARIGRLVLAGSVAYTQRLTDRQTLGLGFQAGVGQRRFDPGLLTFDNQWNGDLHDPTLPTGESFGRTFFFYPDFSTGILWRYATEKGMLVSAGASLAHLHRPAQWFVEGGSPRLPMRWIGHANATVPVSERWDALMQGQFSAQGPYRAWLFGSGARYHLSRQKGREASVSFGARYRWADAAVFFFGIDYQTWSAVLSYDYNTSSFRRATNGAGGPEIGLMYRVAQVRDGAPGKGKVCPVF